MKQQRNIPAIVLTTLIFCVMFKVGCSPENLLLDGPTLPNPQDTSLPRVSGVVPSDQNSIETSGRLEIYFSEPMDPTTINSTTITVEMGNINLSGTLTYSEELRKAYFTPSTEFEDDEAFLLTISSSVLDRKGKSVDGNANGVMDGSPYDDFRSTFYTGFGWDKLQDIDPPRVQGYGPTGGGNSTMPTIWIDFDEETGMDTTRLDNNNIRLFTDTGAEIGLVRQSVSEDYVSFQPTYELTNCRKYRVTVTSDNIWDTSDDRFPLDSDEDGWEENEEDFTWEFITREDSNCNATPPNPRVAIFSTYVSINFFEEMNTTTFTASNIRAFDSNGYIPGTFEIDVGREGLTYYFDRDATGSVCIWISHEVSDMSGNMLDSDGDDIPGEPDEDDYSYPGGCP